MQNAMKYLSLILTKPKYTNTPFKTETTLPNYAIFAHMVDFQVNYIYIYSRIFELKKE